MTDTEETKLKTLAHNLLKATPAEIAAKCTAHKFIEYCEAVRAKLLASKISGRLQLASQLGLKVNQMWEVKTDAQIVEMVREVFPNASVISVGQQSVTNTPEKERDRKPRSPAETQLMLSPAARALPPPENPMGALPIPGQRLDDPDDLPW